MRELVGPTDVSAFDNPTGGLVFPYLDSSAYRSVFDFGCGCGRVARQLIQQDPRPERYVGIDLHPGMIRCCNQNLAPRAPGFEFHHHVVFDRFFNPTGPEDDVRHFGVENQAFTLVNAFSVFTHITQRDVAFYLGEVARILVDDGVVHSSWFLFDKRLFPMLQEANNALYVDEVYPRAAVIFDREWVRSVARNAGLIIYEVIPPAIRGYQWLLLMAPASSERKEVDIPEDSGVIEHVKLPNMPEEAHRIGLGAEPKKHFMASDTS